MVQIDNKAELDRDTRKQLEREKDKKAGFDTQENSDAAETRNQI